MFQSARLKLTLWYVLIFLVINGALSGLVYAAINQVIDNHYDRILSELQSEHGRIFPELANFRIFLANQERLETKDEFAV